MKIQQISPAEITPYQQNSRNHSAEQVQRIAASIKEFGFNQPIVIDEDSEVLVGHGRLLAALALKLKLVPVVRRENLSVAQKRAYRILDNKLQNDSDWDFAALEKEIAALEAQGFDLEKWGLNELQLSDVAPKEFDESIVDGIAAEVMFKIKIPVESSDAFEKKLDDVLRKFPDAKKEKTV